MANETARLPHSDGAQMIRVQLSLVVLADIQMIYTLYESNVRFSKEEEKHQHRPGIVEG